MAPTFPYVKSHIGRKKDEEGMSPDSGLWDPLLEAIGWSGPGCTEKAPWDPMKSNDFPYLVRNSNPIKRSVTDFRGWAEGVR